MSVRIKFWGVRGSYPVPGSKTSRYGGNTSCVQIVRQEGTIVIIDAGTGIRKLGKALMSGPCKDGRGICHLLISHTHWDHIQGLPFFAPLYVAGNQVKIYARQHDVHLNKIFCSQTAEPYFPINLDDVAAQVSYIPLSEGHQFEVEGVQINVARLNHPSIALGYRLTADGVSIAYISDTAPFDRILLEHKFISSRPDPEESPSRTDAAKLAAIKGGVLDLLRGCELVIYDTMFNEEEYRATPHWGHSTPEQALEMVQTLGGDPCLVLYHHGPTRSDDQLEKMVQEYQSRYAVRILAAREGSSLLVSPGQVEEEDGS